MTNSRSRRAFSALIAGALMLSLPAFSDAITVTDVLGHTVEMPENSSRILLGFYFEDTFAVGGPDVYDALSASLNKFEKTGPVCSGVPMLRSCQTLQRLQMLAQLSRAHILT